MAQASSSSSSSSAAQVTGGNITVNPPNYAIWAVAGLAVLVLGFFLLRKRK